MVEVLVISGGVYSPQKVSMTIEKEPVEDGSPIQKLVIFHCHVSFQGCKSFLFQRSGDEQHKPTNSGVGPRAMVGKSSKSMGNTCLNGFMAKL